MELGDRFRFQVVMLHNHGEDGQRTGPHRKKRARASEGHIADIRTRRKMGGRKGHRGVARSRQGKRNGRKATTDARGGSEPSAGVKSQKKPLPSATITPASVNKDADQPQHTTQEKYTVCNPFLKKK